MHFNFKDLELDKRILKAVKELGFETPTPIQEKVIPYILEGDRDIVGLAQTGTGKTAAFGLPILDRMDTGSNDVQTLVLCPTRELCLQITNDMVNYSRYISGVSITPVYGGAAFEPQIKSIRRGTHVIVATPGRLLDLINRRIADIGKIQYLVLDEADIMMNMGFKEELDAILQAAPKTRQTLLFSATMPNEVARIASSYMKDTIEISVGEKNSGTASVEHKYFMVHAKDKYLALKRIVDFYPDIYGIIFCKTRINTQEIADQMFKDGYNAEALHGDLSQSQREFVMRKFRQRNLQLLVATDIAARGLDVNNLTHIIHFDLPDELDVYTHRSGRTGRAGKTGISFSIVNMKEKHKIKMIEKTLKRPITEAKVPLGKDICEKQLIYLADRLKTANVNSELIVPFMPVIEREFADLDRETLLKHFLSLEFNQFLNYYQNAPDLTPVVKEKEKKNSYKNNVLDTGYTNLFINLGKKDRVLPLHLIGLINQNTRNRNIKFGQIDIAAERSRIQVQSNRFDEVYNALSGSRYKGKRLILERENMKKGKLKSRKNVRA